MLAKAHKDREDTDSKQENGLPQQRTESLQTAANRLSYKSLYNP